VTALKLVLPSGVTKEETVVTLDVMGMSSGG
jgi:hypothetical protein